MNGRRLAAASAVLAVPALLWGGLCTAMAFGQESLVFFPEKGLAATPASIGLAFEDAPLVTRDGLRLGAWWVPAPAARGALVFCHGNAGTIAHRLDAIAMFRNLGLSVLAFDYRGYGTSEGKPSEEGTYADMDAAVDEALRRGFAADRQVFFGESLGGAVAVEAASRRPPAALILESTFTNLPDMARHHYPWVPARLLLRIHYDSLSRIPAVACPKLILHGPADEIVPYALGRALFEAAAPPKRFGELRGGHNDGGLTVSPEAREVLASFLDETLGKAGREAPAS